MRRGDFRTGSEVCKVDEDLGLVFGFGVICTENGEPYFDKQDDHVPDAAMLEAAAEFVSRSSATTDMHARDEDGAIPVDGEVVFAFPLTAEIAKAYGIETPKTGLMVGVRPSPEVLAKFRSGAYRGFSIGGRRIESRNAREGS